MGKVSPIAVDIICYDNSLRIFASKILIFTYIIVNTKKLTPPVTLLSLTTARPLIMCNGDLILSQYKISTLNTE